MGTDIIPALSAGGLSATPTGLVASGDIPFPVWLAYGEGLRRVEAAVQWVVGDWLNYGEGHYPEKHGEAFMLWPESSYHTLENWKSVAYRIHSSLRRETLTWSHHEAVAKLEPGEQTRWLELADVGNWSVRELREALRPEAKDEERCDKCGAARRHWRME